MEAQRRFDSEQIVEKIWQKQLASFDSGNLIPAEQLLLDHPELSDAPEMIVDVVLNEFELVSKLKPGDQCQKDLLDRFPQVREQLEKQFDVWNSFETAQAKSSDTVAELDSAQSSIGNESLRFVDREIVGRGSTAIVETAFDQRLRQRVALKRLHVHLSQSDRARGRFYREAQAVSRLHHPGIVPVFEITQEKSNFVIVSRFVDGANLRQLVEAGTEYSVDDIAKWIAQIADALEYSHQNGIVHRDVKPSNILINREGNAQLIDFGLATVSESGSEITATGDLVGTPAFMSPEQAAGKWEEIGPWTDVYSVGATLYFLLSKRAPFQGNLSSVVRSVVDDVPARIESSLVDRNDDLLTIMDMCLSKSPSGRYKSARDLADELRRYRTGEIVLAKRASKSERAFKYIARNPFRFASLATILLMAAFLSGSLLQLGEVRMQRNRAEKAELAQRQLVFSASVDAGRLSMRQGRFDQATQHLATAINGQVADEVEVRLLLVECLIATGQIDRAAEELGIAKQGSDIREHDALIEYWELELAALGHPDYADDRFRGRRADLSPSKQLFLAGLESEESEEALAFFRESFLADPYHHSARKMYLVMALSLADFQTVRDESQRATQLYPDDVDFRLFNAVAMAAQQDFEAAAASLGEIPMSAMERERWIEFFSFLEEVSKPLADQEFFLVQRLDWFAETFGTFLDRHLSLFESRGWRFPSKIAMRFSNVADKYQAGADFEELSGEFRELVNVHPEGTLLAIMAESILAGVEIDDWETVEEGQLVLKKAVGRPAWLGLAPESSWLSLYSTAMTLRVVHKRDKQENGELMIEAANNIDSAWLQYPGNVKGMVIPLFNMHQWESVKPFLHRWIELAKTDDAKEEAWWHMAVWHRYQEDWVSVIQKCDEADGILPSGKKRRYNWSGLRNRAIRELKTILNSVSEE